MALKDWKKDEGWESPAWYNIKFNNLKTGEYMITANTGKSEGSPEPNDTWSLSHFTNMDAETSESKQHNFKSKAKMLEYVKKYMRLH